jgi:rubredoxin-NAD+ reductase
VVVAAKKIKYSKLVLATGSEVIKPLVLGNAAHRICSVNDLEDYARFRELITDQKKIAVLGAGLVGCEFANDLANTGYEVHVIDPALYPLQRLVPKEIGQVLQVSLQEKNVHWHLGELVNEMNYDDPRYHLLLSNGQQFQVDAVLSAIGLRPNIQLAKEAMLDTNFGILVNRYLQTSAPDIYALGDCAEVHGLVLFFVMPLIQCAKSLAQTLTGKLTEVIYPAMPISIKTSLCPIVVLPPPKNSVGQWQITGEGKDFKALFYDEKKHLCGFALTGKKVIEKMKLVNEVDAST